ncbi:MAG: hypothetical protein ACRDJO_12795 [Actinomycetota bacterium]
MDDERAVAWTAMPTKVPVLAADGTDVGTAEAVLGDVARDIFHGIVVKLEGGRHVELLADDVARITTERVRAHLGPTQIDVLPDYEGEISGLEGLLRKVGDRLEST